MTKPTFREGPLPVLCSCRIRISEEKREELRKAHAALRGEHVNTQAPVNAGSTLTVTTNAEAPISAYTRYGFSPVVVSDLIGTRDSLALPVILKLQQLFNVEIVSRKELERAFKSYLDYLDV